MQSLSVCECMRERHNWCMLSLSVRLLIEIVSVCVCAYALRRSCRLNCVSVCLFVRARFHLSSRQTQQSRLFTVSSHWWDIGFVTDKQAANCRWNLTTANINKIPNQQPHSQQQQQKKRRKAKTDDQKERKKQVKQGALACFRMGVAFVCVECIRLCVLWYNKKQSRYIDSIVCESVPPYTRHTVSSKRAAPTQA